MGATQDNEARRSVEIELGGKKYTVRELELDDIGEIENMIRSRNARLYRDISGDLDPELREQGVMKLLKSVVTEEEYSAEMTSGDCIMYAAYLMMRHNPGVTREAMPRIVSRKNLHVVKTAMQSAEGDEGNDEDKSPRVVEPEENSLAGKSVPPSPDTTPDGLTQTQES